MIFRIVKVDAGVAEIDIQTKKMKEEQKMKEAQATAVAEHGEVALITVEGIQSANRKITIEATNVAGYQTFQLCSIYGNYFRHSEPFLTFLKFFKLLIS